MSESPTLSACQTCGACCQSYRVEFAVYELDEMGGQVPAALTEVVKGNTCRMRGTGEVPIRCVALQGEVGQWVACGIYLQRPAPCAELQEGTFGCNKARVRHGLPPLGEWLGN
jgi:Fe-S-cluster containining protein